MPFYFLLLSLLSPLVSAAPIDCAGHLIELTRPTQNEPESTPISGVPLKIGDALKLKAANGRKVPAVFVGQFGKDLYFGWKSRFLGKVTSLIRINLERSSVSWDKDGILVVRAEPNNQNFQCAGVCELGRIPEKIESYTKDSRYWFENIRIFGMEVGQNQVRPQRDEFQDGYIRETRLTDNSPTIMEHLIQGKPAVLRLELQNSVNVWEMGRGLHLVYDQNLKNQKVDFPGGKAKEHVISKFPLTAKNAFLGFEGGNWSKEVVAIGAFKKSMGRWIIVAIDPVNYGTGGPSLMFIEGIDRFGGGKGLAHANPGVHRGILFNSLDDLWRGPAALGPKYRATGSEVNASDISWALDILGATAETP